MGLSFNPKTNDYVVYTNDPKRAEDVGLTRATRVRGPKGEHVFFTQDGYAALPFWKDADGSAKARLGSLYTDYAASWATECDTEYRVGQAGSTLKLRPYQNAGIKYGLAHRNCLIGDEMGIGKTAQAIGIANEVQAERVLVICPASIRLGWRKQIKMWSTIPQVRALPILKSSDGVARWPNYTIISYELMRNPDIHQALRGIDWDMMVIDEAHFLKSHNAQRTHAIFGGGRHAELKLSMAERAKRVVCLTGTPLPNRPKECFTLAKALNWEAIDWMNFEEFCYKFNPSARVTGTRADGTDYTFNKEEMGRLPELHARLRCNFMIRRLKKDVLKDLPEKQYEFAYIEKTGAIREAIRRERMLQFQIKDLVNPTADIMGEIATVRRQMGEAKLPLAVEHLKYLLDIEEIPKLVIFSHHRSVMDGLKLALQKYGVVEVRGGMGSQAKENSVQQFQTNPRIRIFSGQLDAAGFGIDGLQNVASRCVIIEPAWTPGTNDQAIDRIHRLGQMNPVLAQFLIAEGSLDERILSAVLDKAYTINEVLDQQDTGRVAA